MLGGAGATGSVVAVTAEAGGDGYRMVAADGGIFAFGAPFYGSRGSDPPPARVTTMAPSVSGKGYYLLDAVGDVYAYGDAPFLGRARVG